MRTTLLILGLLITVSVHAAVQTPGGVRPGQRQLPPRDAIAGEAPRGTAVIRGTVVAADNGSPIRRAQVRITGQGARLATTDAQGRFEIRDLPGGRYTLSASKGGFVSVQYGPPSLGIGHTARHRRRAHARKGHHRLAPWQRHQRPHHR